MFSSSKVLMYFITEKIAVINSVLFFFHKVTLPPLLSKRKSGKIVSFNLFFGTLNQKLLIVFFHQRFFFFFQFFFYAPKVTGLINSFPLEQVLFGTPPPLKSGV